MRRRFLLPGSLAAIFAVGVLVHSTPSAAVDACAAPANEIVAENCKPGTPPSVWDVPGGGSGAISGFTTDISTAQGGTVSFKVKSAAGYRIDLYRLGWYGGNGARQVGTIGPLVANDQSPCPANATTGRIACPWSVTAAWSVPADAVSGIYLAHLVAADGAEGHIPFVVRDDDGGSDVLFQTSDTTWQAYNQLGGNSLYVGQPAGRAYEVSYDRPFTTRTTGPEDFVFNAEFPMLRWLERNGYDVSYSSGADTDRRGAELLEHRTFLSVGHDEYWSGQQRRNVEAARDAGVNLAFFSGNEVFWKTRWTDDHRTLVTYKETHANEKIDPSPEWTGSWRDGRPANTERTTPENALTGTLFTVNAGDRAIEVPAADGRLRLWRGTSVAAQAAAGATAVLPERTLGYEWDEDVDNGSRPPGLVRFSTTAATGVDLLQDEGSTYAPGDATHHLTMYRDANGARPDALVFGAGTVQWSWGLDATHDRQETPVSPAMQQATANLLADMDAQPATPQDVQPAAKSTDRLVPSAVVDPEFAVVRPTPLALATITGTAADAGGGRVGAVEVSLDGGATWHPADGRERWSYTWMAKDAAEVHPQVRAADDSGNLFPAPPDDVPGAGTGTGGAGAAGAGGRRRVRVGPPRARVSRRGVVRLRVTCPPGKACRLRLRLRAHGRRIAAARATIAAGATRRVKLTLRPRALRRLERKGTQRVTVVVRSAGQATPVRTRIRLIAPRKR